MAAFRKAQYVSSRYQDPFEAGTKRPSGSKLEQHRGAQRAFRVDDPLPDFSDGVDDRNLKPELAEQAAHNAGTSTGVVCAGGKIDSRPAANRMSTSHILCRALQQDLCRVLACLAEELRKFHHGTPHVTARWDIRQP